MPHLGTVPGCCWGAGGPARWRWRLSALCYCREGPARWRADLGQRQAGWPGLGCGCAVRLPGGLSPRSGRLARTAPGGVPSKVCPKGRACAPLTAAKRPRPVWYALWVTGRGENPASPSLSFPPLRGRAGGVGAVPPQVFRGLGRCRGSRAGFLGVPGDVSGPLPAGGDEQAGSLAGLLGGDKRGLGGVAL